MRSQSRNHRRRVETAFHAVPDPDAAVAAADKIKPPVRLQFFVDGGNASQVANRILGYSPKPAVYREEHRFRGDARDLAGDVLIAIDGEALLDTFDLIYALKRKRTGSQGLLQIERQGVTLSVDVLFRQKDGTHPPLKQ